MSQPAADRRRRNFVQRTTAWIPALLAVLLLAPMALTHRSFGADWTLHLWLVRQQQFNLQTLWHPGLFVSAEPLGVFYPVFAFVGSGMYTLGGLLAIVLGDRPTLAYKLLYLGGFCLGYGGMTWLSIQVGLRGWRSQIPGLVFVTGAYFITDMAGRGDFGEFVAVASIPFLVAAVCATFTAPSLRVRNLLALVLGTFVLSGSHNITLLWGSVFVTLLGCIGVLAFASSWRPSMLRKRVGTLMLGAAMGVGLNAWFLMPDLAFGFDTRGAQASQGRLPSVRLTGVGYLLNPLRTAPPTSLLQDIRVTLPWMFAAWALVFGIAFWRNQDRPSRTLFAGLFGLIAAFLVLILDKSAWSSLPSVLYNLQFTWRLHAYLLLATAGLVMIVLRWHANASGSVRRAATFVLLGFVAFNVGVATWQVWRVRSTAAQHGHFRPTSDKYLDAVVAARWTAPSSWYAPTQFRDTSAPVIATDPGRIVTVPASEVEGDHFAGVVDAPDGPSPFKTNISAGHYFLRIHGITAVGRSLDGFLVAVRARDAPISGPLKVTIQRADSAVFTLGAGLSLLSFLALLSVLCLAGLRSFRVRRRPTGGSSGENAMSVESG